MYQDWKLGTHCKVEEKNGVGVRGGQLGVKLGSNFPRVFWPFVSRVSLPRLSLGRNFGHVKKRERYSFHLGFEWKRLRRYFPLRQPRKHIGNLLAIRIHWVCRLCDSGLGKSKLGRFEGWETYYPLQ